MNKISLFFAAAILFCSAANAQLQKDNSIVGAGFANLKLGLNKGDGYNIDIYVYQAWFIRDNFALGFKINYDAIGSQYDGNNAVVTYDVLSRYYFHKPGVDLLKHACFFAEETAGLEVNSYGSYITRGLGFSIGPGVSFFITPNISFEALVKYKGLVSFRSALQNSDYISNQDSNQALYQHFLSVNVGCSFFLRHPKLKNIFSHKQRD